MNTFEKLMSKRGREDQTQEKLEEVIFDKHDRKAKVDVTHSPKEKEQLTDMQTERFIEEARKKDIENAKKEDRKEESESQITQG